MKWSFIVPLILLAIPCLAVLQPDPVNTEESVLMMVGNNLSRDGNFYLYYPVSTKEVVVQKGDTLEYDLFIPGRSTETNGAVDLDFTDESFLLRDSGIVDQNGLRIHPNEPMPRAKDTWYHRAIPLDDAAGKTVKTWNLVFEGDAPGAYVLFVGKLGIRHADGSWDWAYNGGAAPAPAKPTRSGGYSRVVYVKAVDRDWVTPANIDKVVSEQSAAFEREAVVNEFETDVDIVESFAKSSPEGSSYTQHIESARESLNKIKADPQISTEQMHSLIHEGRDELGHTHTLMDAYTGHLVGHSHIDFQWLWEWPESYEISRSTFGTVANLMDEFPDFKFSQSSSALYKLTEQYYPDVFKRIKQKVARGHWDLVGGRVCEGDTNMVSPESHARQFLLGQRYFQGAFGKMATVGWEPDTFGHAWSMPQILKMGGCDTYYFCRGGKDKPLFWWEGPDGTKILTFDEVASGSWYNADVTQDTVNELIPWKQKTGLGSMMWIFGVGDHGGGVTREQIQAGLKLQQSKFMPNVKFSTATQFFDAIQKQDLSQLPTVSAELNPVFNGCYTTHSDIKRLNRDAENITATAETAATIANLFGQPYPQKTFNDNWEAICFNHHHDTLPGSAIHESYVKTREQLGAVVASSQNIAGDSVRYIATLMKRHDKAEYNVAAFNPLGWKHSAVVKVPWPYPPADSSWAARAKARSNLSDLTPDLSPDQKWVAVAPNGLTLPVTVIRGQRADNPSGEPVAIFEAVDVPGFGYRVFGLRPAQPTDTLTETVTLNRQADNTYVLENAALRVTVNGANGLITSLFDKSAGRETIEAGGAGNRLEIWDEKPVGMSAWVLGEYAGHRALDDPAEIRLLDYTYGTITLEVTRTYKNSRIVQHITLRAGADRVDIPVWVDWQEVGNGRDPSPLLKLTCDVAGADLKASYEIPFATIQRPANGEECVALKSADLSNADGGITLVNDSRSGHTAEGNTLRISLLRASYDPDRMADQRSHFIGMALVPHEGPYGAAQVKRGFEFNQGFIGVRVPPSSNGALPLEKSFMLVVGDNIVSTVIKRSEDDPKAMLVRMYEANGTQSPMTLSMDTAVAATQWMNFVEHPLSGLETSPVVNANLRKYEIRNLMLYREKPKASARTGSGRK